MRRRRSAQLGGPTDLRPTCPWCRRTGQAPGMAPLRHEGTIDISTLTALRPRSTRPLCVSTRAGRCSSVRAAWTSVPGRAPGSAHPPVRMVPGTTPMGFAFRVLRRLGFSHFPTRTLLLVCEKPGRRLPLFFSEQPHPSCRVARLSVGNSYRPATVPPCSNKAAGIPPGDIDREPDGVGRAWNP